MAFWEAFLFIHHHGNGVCWISWDGNVSGSITFGQNKIFEKTIDMKLITDIDGSQ